jgi:ABC-type branched-subunit amino acid transport system substrate-binding protein
MPRRSLLLLLAASLLGCQDPTTLFAPPPEEPTPVEVDYRRLHVMLPLEGPFAELGLAWLHAAELGLAEVESAGVLREDREITLQWHDTAFDPDLAAAAAQDVLDSPGPHVVVGPMSSSEVLWVQIEAAEALFGGELALLSPTASSPELDGDRGVLRLVNDVTAYAERLAEFSTGIDGVVRACKNAVVLTQDDLFNQRTADAFKRRFEELEGQLVLDSTFAPDATDVALQGLATSAAAAIELAAIDDGVCLAVFGFPMPASVLIDETRTRGPAEALVSVIVGEVSVADLTGGTPEVPVLTLSPTHARGAGLERLEALWDEGEHGPIPAFAPMVFDAAVLGALALGAVPDGASIDETIIALSAQGAPFGPTGLAAARDALQAGDDVDYVGASGPVDLDTETYAAAGPLAVLREIGEGWEEVEVLDPR